jgi:DNA-binding NarL/FixJ family response regulator
MAGTEETTADIAVTMETASPSERLDLFSRAHGLSPREAELVAALAGGSDTRQVAHKMHVSDNTIQDHLKSIFVKTGTRSRRALLARALGN